MTNSTPLHHIPRNSYVKLISVEGTKIPPAAPDIKIGEVILFHHIDGMYSFCKNKKDEIVHLAAWAEVEIVDGWDE